MCEAPPPGTKLGWSLRFFCQTSIVGSNEIHESPLFPIRFKKHLCNFTKTFFSQIIIECVIYLYTYIHLLKIFYYVKHLNPKFLIVTKTFWLKSCIQIKTIESITDREQMLQPTMPSIPDLFYTTVR